jgi:hypothetical protein
LLCCCLLVCQSTSSYLFIFFTLVTHTVTCSSHPSRCWPCSLLLSLRDHKRHSTASPVKLALLEAGQYKFPLYCPLNFPPFRKSLSWGLTWALSGCLAQQRSYPCIAITLWLPDSAMSEHKPFFFPDDTHNHSRMKSRPDMDAKVREFMKLNPKKASCQTPESLRCHHFVTCSGDPSRCWPRSPLRDQERPYRIARKVNSLARQYKFPLRTDDTNKKIS